LICGCSDFDNCGAVGIVGVGVGSEALNALITAVLRVYEELGVNCFVPIYTSRISNIDFAKFCKLGLF